MIEDALANNPKIREAELEALHDDAWQWCRSLAGAEADDVLQQVYVLLIEGRARYRAEASLKTWLFAVIRRTALKDRARRRKWAGLDAVSEEPRTEDSAHGFSMSGYLSRLPQKQKEVLELSLYREFTLEECARIMGVRVGTARTHYHRGKLAVKAMLEEDGVRNE